MSDYITKVIDKDGAEFDIRDERVPASTTADAGKSVVVDAQGKLALGEAQSTDIAPSQIKATAADSGKIISIDAQGSGTLIDPVASEDELEIVELQEGLTLTAAQLKKAKEGKIILKYSPYGDVPKYCELVDIDSTDLNFVGIEPISSSSGDAVIYESMLCKMSPRINKSTGALESGWTGMSFYNAVDSRPANFLESSSISSSNGKKLIREMNVADRLCGNVEYSVDSASGTLSLSNDDIRALTSSAVTRLKLLYDGKTLVAFVPTLSSSDSGYGVQLQQISFLNFPDLTVRNMRAEIDIANDTLRWSEYRSIQLKQIPAFAAADANKVLKVNAAGTALEYGTVSVADEFAFLSFDFDSRQAATGTISLTQAQIDACTAARFIYVKGNNEAWGTALSGVIEKETSNANYCAIVADYYLYGDMRMYSAHVDLDLANGTLTWRDVGKSIFNAAGIVVAIKVTVNGIYQNRTPDLTVKKLYSTGTEETLNAWDYHVECDTSALGSSMLYVDYDGFSFVKPVTVEEYIPDLPSWIDGTKIVDNKLKSYSVDASSCTDNVIIEHKYKYNGDTLTINKIGNTIFKLTQYSSVSSVTFAEGITTISGYAISDLSSLTDVYIPASVTGISNDFISYCPLAFAHIAAGNANYVEENSIVYDINKTEIIYYPQALTATSYVMPNTLTSFKATSEYLQSLTISDACNSISLYDCTALTTISVSSGNTTFAIVDSCVVDYNDHTILMNVPQAMFAGTTAIIPSAITTFYAYCCQRLQATSIQWPLSVTGFGQASFYGATGLGNLDLASIGGNVDYWAFFDTDMTSLRISVDQLSTADAIVNNQLLTTVTLVPSVSGTLNRNFDQCPNITSLNFEGTTSDWSSVNKSSDWSQNLPQSITVVHCSDGDVAI